MTKAVVRILLGAIYGYVCYVVVLWLVATAAPRLTLYGEHMEAALYWPKNVYMYYLPSKWAGTSTAESLLTVGGALLILRGMVAAARKAKRERMALMPVRSRRHFN